MNLKGIHHLTAVTARAADNHRFYTGTLGLRLVKKTVNQDDVSAYHLFYADGIASPGTDITFFDWPVGPETRGTHSICRTGFRVGGADQLAFWAKHLRDAGVKSGDIVVRDGRATLDFEDFEGQRLSLVDDAGRATAMLGPRARLTPQTRSAGWGRSRSACLTSPRPMLCCAL